MYRRVNIKFALHATSSIDMSEQDDELLANVGRTGEIDSSKWNELRAKLLERLDQVLLPFSSLNIDLFARRIYKEHFL